MQIRIFGYPKIHAKSGKFSVTVERVELMGEGALRRAFELLKKKLAAEGLFAIERKRPLPRFPESVGLIASRESAAYSDFLRILGGRWGGLKIHSAHVQVQGRDAVADIVGAFKYFNAHPGLADVLVLTRGGGSLEDLQAFNSEEVVRAVFGSAIPVVVGVGHERDETLADYAADLRASTPTHAAELLAPHRREVAAFVDGGVERMHGALRGAVGGRAAAIDGMARQIEAHARRRIDDFRHLLLDFARHFAAFRTSNASRLAQGAALASRLSSSASFWAGRFRTAIEAQERLLANVDPRRILSRGYALVRAGGKIVKSAQAVDIGQTVDIQLHQGRIMSKVTEKL